MKKIFLAFAIFALASIGLAGPIAVVNNLAVSPGATFFQQLANDSCSAGSASAMCTGASFFYPDYVSLAGLQGSTLDITIDESSSICLLPTNFADPHCGNPNLAGMFSSQDFAHYDTTTTDANRVGGSVASGLGPSAGTYVALNAQAFTFSDSTANVFSIPYGSSSFQIVVPNDANFLVLGLFDSWLADNSGGISVTITATDPPSPAPEPASCLMVLGAAGALALFRKLRA